MVASVAVGTERAALTRGGIDGRNHGGWDNNHTRRVKPGESIKLLSKTDALVSHRTFNVLQAIQKRCGCHTPHFPVTIGLHSGERQVEAI